MPTTPRRAPTRLAAASALPAALPLALAAALAALAACGPEPRAGEGADGGGEAGLAGLIQEREKAIRAVEGLGYDRGSPEAPVTVVEFSDFGCPYCREFAAETYPDLHEEFVETGRVRWRYVPFVLGIFPNGAEAAVAGECAGRQDRFFDLHGPLFETQREWKQAPEPGRVFRRLADSVGLDVERFERCYREREPAARVESATRTAFEMGVRSTPTFFVEGFPIRGAVPTGPFREFLTYILREKGTEAP